MQVEATIEEAHRYGLKHKAVAVILFTKDRELLITLRSKKKLGGGFWEMPATHVIRENDGFLQVAQKCIERELGIYEDLKLDCLGNFDYRVELPNEGYIENENVEVMIAEYNGEITPNKNEIDEFEWIPIETLEYDIINHSENYTFWLSKGFLALEGKLKEYLEKH